MRIVIFFLAILATSFLYAQGPTVEQKDFIFARQRLRVGNDTSRYWTSITPTISAGSTLKQGTSAKAVYDYCQQFLTAETPQTLSTNPGVLSISGGNSVTVDTDPADDVTTDMNLGIDLQGNLPNATVIGIQTYPVSATAPGTGQVLKWNGTTWSPAADDGTNVSAGTGISVSGTPPNITISNTAPDQTVTIAGATGTYPNFTIPDISATNELQTISYSAPNLTLSGGGGSVAIPQGTVGGTGVNNQWAYWNGTTGLTTNNILQNNSGHLNANAALSFQLPIRTADINVNNAVYARSDLSDNIFYRKSSNTYRPVVLGKEFSSLTYGDYTANQLHIPELYGIMWGVNGTRWNVINTGTTAAGGTYVRTYSLNPNAASPGYNGLTYTEGAMYFGFYYNVTPQAISVRVRNFSGTWAGPYTVNMVSQNNSSPTLYPLYRLDLGNVFNFLTDIEITITNPASTSLIWHLFDYIPTNDQGISQPRAFFNKNIAEFLPNPIGFWDGVSRKVFISNNGNYFTSGAHNVVAIGTETLIGNTALTLVNTIADNGNYYHQRNRTIAGLEVFNTRGDGAVGIGTLPGSVNWRTTINGFATTSSTFGLMVRDGSAGNTFGVRDNGDIIHYRQTGTGFRLVQYDANGVTSRSTIDPATLVTSNLYTADGSFPTTRVITTGNFPLVLDASTASSTISTPLLIKGKADGTNSTQAITFQNSAGSPKGYITTANTGITVGATAGNALTLGSGLNGWRFDEAGFFQAPSLATNPTVTNKDAAIWYNNTADRYMYNAATSGTTLRTIATYENDFVGSSILSTSSSFTLTGTQYWITLGANSNAVSCTCDGNMIEGMTYVVKCRQNTTNTVTINAGAGYNLVVDGDPAVTASPYVCASGELLRISRYDTTIFVDK